MTNSIMHKIHQTVESIGIHNFECEVDYGMPSKLYDICLEVDNVVDQISVFTRLSITDILT